MKKFTLVIGSLALVIVSIFVACNKGGETTPTNNTPTVNSCVDSGYVFADSLSCSGINLIYIINRNKIYALPNGYTAIDTMVNGASIYLTYDTLSTKSPCKGAIYNNISISCFKRK